MADIFIPGDELDEARRALGFVQDHIDLGQGTFDFDRAFGRDLSGSAANFERKWKDGKGELIKQLEQIKGAMDSIMDSFQKTDQDAASRLSSGTEDGR